MKYPFLRGVFLFILIAAAAVEASNPITNYTTEVSTQDNPASWATYVDGICDNTNSIDSEWYPTGFYSPFFASDNTSWFVTNYAFLSPAGSRMCNYYCRDESFSTLNGYYNFETVESYQLAGGRWYGTGGNWPLIGLYVSELDKTANSKRCARVDSTGLTVEYKDFYDSSSGEYLTAQVSVTEDGVITMRYSSVPSSTDASAVRPSVGLVYSANLRMSVDPPTASNGINGYRFSPLPTACSSLTTSSACSSSSACSWCTTTASCSLADYQADICPSTQYSTSESFQRFYDVSVEESASWSGLDGSLLDPSQPITLDLGFDFPFFNRQSTVSSVTFLSPSIISVLSTTQDCRPLWNTCYNRNYSYSILPFQTALVFDSSSTVKSKRLAQRSNGDPYCTKASCPKGFLLEVRGLSPYVFRNTGSPITFSYLLYLDEEGVIKVTYGGGGKNGRVLFTYPPPVVGLVRHNASDPSSILFPNTLVRIGTEITFTPSSTCVDCGLHGACSTTGVCKCSDGFQGDLCDECEANHYGPLCESCSCSSGCDDGISGTGACTTKCGSCNLNHGTCEGHTCKCDAGWTGSSCGVREDTCMPLSFDGCPYCAGDTCNFCFDNTCFNPAVSGTSRGYACSYSIDTTRNFLCTFLSQDVFEPLDYGIPLIIALSAIIAGLLVVACFAVVYVVRRRNVFDVHVKLAMGGSSNSAPAARERLVVPVSFIRRDAVPRGTYVFGLPLRQVPLRSLYEQRYAELKD